MKRPNVAPRALATITVIVVLIAAVVTGIILLATGDGATAFTVNGRPTSQASIDDELQALAENSALAKAVAQSQNGQSLMTTNGSVGTNLARGWVGLEIALEAVGQDAAKGGVHVTAADRTEGAVLAGQAIVDRAVFATFPRWFRDRLTARWAKVAASARVLIDSNRASVVAAARADCPSGRFVARIVVATVTEAAALKQQLAGGADFATLAKQHSLDEASGIDGGDLGCIDGRQDLPQQVADAAKTQPIGAVSDPIQTTAGVHLIIVRSDPPDSTLRGYATNAIFSNVHPTVTVDPKYGTWNTKLRQVDAPHVPDARPASGG